MTNTEMIALGGGLDLSTPSIMTKPGKCTIAKNYECLPKGGYRRIEGYERTDGRDLPSSASYQVIDFTAGNEEIADETAVTQGANTAVALTQILESGTYGGGDAAGYLVLTKVVGTWLTTTDIKVGGVTKCVSASAPGFAGTDSLHDTYSQLAQEYYRSLIGAVPGINTIRGVWTYKGVDYAFRDYDATTLKMYKSTTSGWTEVALGRQLNFTSGGTYEIAEGDVITGETSTATATVTRVVVTSGTWAGGDAAGYVVFASQTGTFASETIKVGANLNVATIAGNSSAITLEDGGRFNFVNHNFYGGTSTQRMYGADGVNKAFEFDGTVFCPISTGSAVDTPKIVCAHALHLFLGYYGGSLQQSTVGLPLVWIGGGAAEYGTGDELTALLTAPGGSLAVICRNSTYLLSGTSIADFVLKPLSLSVGALPYTAQSLGAPIFLDDSGLTSLLATQDSDGMRADTFSQDVEKWLTLTKRQLATASMRVRAKDQYRLFFSDDTALYVTMIGRKVVGIMTEDLGLDVSCCCSGEDLTGAEVLLFGSSDGYVYRLDSGNNFDGDAVESYAKLPHNHMGTPTQKKRFRKAILEMTTTKPGGTIAMVPEFSYGSDEYADAVPVTSTIAGGAATFDLSNWDESYWAGQAVGQASSRIDGSGLNISMLIYSTGTYGPPHTISALIIQYDHRGLQR